MYAGAAAALSGRIFAAFILAARALMTADHLPDK